MAEENLEAQGESLHESVGRREFFQAYYGRVYGFFKSRGFDREDALELSQETFVRVFKNISSVRSSASLEGWLLRVAANVWKNEIRARRAGMRAAPEVALDAETDGATGAFGTLEAKDIQNPLDRVLVSEQLGAVEKCLDVLAPRMRHCLVLYAYQEHKYQDIADLLDLSVQTVRSHIHLARQRLEDCVALRLAGGAP